MNFKFFQRYRGNKRAMIAVADTSFLSRDRVFYRKYFEVNGMVGSPCRVVK